MVLPAKYKLIQTSLAKDKEIDWGEKLKKAFYNPISSPTLTDIIKDESNWEDIRPLPLPG